MSVASEWVCTIGAVVCVYVFLCGTWRCVVPCDRTYVVDVYLLACCVVQVTVFKLWSKQVQVQGTCVGGFMMI